MNIHIKNIMAILPFEEGFKAEKTDICIEGEYIKSIGKAAADFKADKIIDGTGKLVSAGLVNAHTHSYMSLFRNCADDLMFHDWLFGTILPMEDQLTPDDIYWGTKLGCLEMIKTGTTAFLDMHICKNAVAKAVTEAKIKGVLSRGLVGKGRNDQGGIQRIQDTIDDYNEFAFNKRIKIMMGPHAVYTTDREYLELVMEKADEYNLGINVHLSESVQEVEDSYKEFGCSPVEYLDNMGMFKRQTVAAHCVQLSDKDIDMLADRGVYAVTNPISNAKLGNGFARIPDMMKRKVKLCIGTDSAASNNTLNMFSDMNFISLIHKGTTRTAQAVTAQETLKMATEVGAQAMGLSDTGVLLENAKADLIIMDLKRPSLQPVTNPVAAMCYSANGTEVETVIVDGEIIMENGKVLTLDEEEIYANCQRIIDRIKK